MTRVFPYPPPRWLLPKPGDLVRVDLDDNRRVVVRLLDPGVAETMLDGLPTYVCSAARAYRLNDVGGDLWARRLFTLSAVAWSGINDEAGPIMIDPDGALRVWDALPAGNRLRLTLEALALDPVVRALLAWMLPVAVPPEGATEAPDVWVEPPTPAPTEPGDRA